MILVLAKPYVSSYAIYIITIGLIMKYALAIATTAFVLSACASGPTTDCTPKSQSLNTPTDFGSVEAAKAYSALPTFSLGFNQSDNAKDVIEQVTSALATYDLMPRAETLFLRRRLAAHEKLLDNANAKADVQRLVALGELYPNEGPYLLSKLEMLTQSPEVRYDRDAQPLVRIPPMMSQAATNGKKSGHCRLEFDVAPQGVVENIRVGYCTDDVFRETSIKSLSRWKYNPAIRNGEAVSRKNVETTVSYRLMDDCGRIYPE